jgi:hypothetical protein
LGEGWPEHDHRSLIPAFQEGLPRTTQKGLTMRIGTWRGVTLAIALTSALLSGRSVRANDPFHHTIPKVVEAIDVNTGGPYYAPPVPYGHYAKDGHLAKSFGLASGLFHGLGSKLHGAGSQCHGCGGKGCGLCGGSGLLSGLGHGHGGAGDSGCSGPGCGGFGHGHGGFGDPGCSGPGCGGHKSFRFKGCGLCGGKGCGVCTTTVMGSMQGSPVSPTGQVVVQSNEGCGKKGCGLGFGHKHSQGGDPGWGNGGCLHGAGMSCGKCSGHGLGFGKGCGACGGRGCGLCMGGHGGQGGNGCQACGGRGCNLCAKAHGLLGKAKGLANGLLHPHAGKIEYFVGPGGPVPITPGYVPYVVTTRSPRDYFAFPPFSPDR